MRSLVTIRDARPADVPVAIAMLRAAAEDQGEPTALCVDERALLQDAFGDSAVCKLLLAEYEGRPAGLAVYFFTYSTWISRMGLYLEDLYVAAPYRRRGVARALMKRLAQIALEHGGGRMTWAVLRKNVRAVRFYESIGAEALSEWMPMRLDERALHKLA